LINQIIVGEEYSSWALSFFGSSCRYVPIMKKGVPNIKIMGFWEDTEYILNYIIYPGTGI
jgi:hypothetical protein